MRFTSRDEVVYAILLGPSGSELVIEDLSAGPDGKISQLGADNRIRHETTGTSTHLQGIVNTDPRGTALRIEAAR